ncbi:hypothetical protein Trydic_g17443 [Trypoxylus dichotomus]
MVGHDSGLPDPPDSDDSLTTNTEIVMMNDSESDDDLNEYNGYEPLPLEADDQEIAVHEEHVIEDIPDTASATLPPLTRMEDTLVQEVWSGTPASVVDITMDKEKEEEVKQAMLNITLPPSSIPAWANMVPEEEWKDHLMQILQCSRKSPKDNV